MITKVGVIGLGNISSRHRKNIKALYPKVDVVAMSSSGRKITEAIENTDKITIDIEGLINEQPDFVIIASPATYHAEHARPLLLARIPVLIEKPVSATTSDVDMLLDLENQTSVPISVGYCIRYLKSAIKIKEYLQQNIIGNIYNVSTSVGQFLPDWRAETNYKNSVSASSKLGGGALLELSHEFDYLYWLLGDLTLEFAQLRTSSELELEVEELADIVLTTNKGCVCNVHLDFLQKKAQRVSSFIGSKGRLDWNLVTNTITLHTKDNTTVLYSEPEWDKNGMYLAMLKDFIQLIANKRNSCISILEASKTVYLIEKIKTEANTGKVQ